MDSSHTHWCPPGMLNLWKATWWSDCRDVPGSCLVSVLTSQSSRTFTSVAAGGADAPTGWTWRRQTLIHVFATEFALFTLRTNTKVLPTASRKTDVRHAGPSVQATAWHHINLGDTKWVDKELIVWIQLLPSTLPAPWRCSGRCTHQRAWNWRTDELLPSGEPKGPSRWGGQQETAQPPPVRPPAETGSPSPLGQTPQTGRRNSLRQMSAGCSEAGGKMEACLLENRQRPDRYPVVYQSNTSGYPHLLIYCSPTRKIWWQKLPVFREALYNQALPGWIIVNMQVQTCKKLFQLHVQNVLGMSYFLKFCTHLWFISPTDHCFVTIESDFLWL